jgi:Na+/melibiose symporter-like transporter
VCSSDLSEVSYLLIPYIGSGIFGAPIWARIAGRFGKHRAIQLACVGYGITQAILMAIPAKMLAPTAVGMFAVGFCASAFIPLMRSMVADVTDELRLTTGKERAGVLYSLVILVQKFGTSVTAIIVLPILDAVGFDPKPHAVNTPEAIFGLQMCYLFAPIIFVLIGALVFFGYKLTPARHAEIRAALDEQARVSLASAEETFTGAAEAPPKPA